MTPNSFSPYWESGVGLAHRVKEGRIRVYTMEAHAHTVKIILPLHTPHNPLTLHPYPYQIHTILHLNPYHTTTLTHTIPYSHPYHTHTIPHPNPYPHTHTRPLQHSLTLPRSLPPSAVTRLFLSDLTFVVYTSPRHGKHIPHPYRRLTHPSIHPSIRLFLDPSIRSRVLGET